MGFLVFGLTVGGGFFVYRNFIIPNLTKLAPEKSSFILKEAADRNTVLTVDERKKEARVYFQNKRIVKSDISDISKEDWLKFPPSGEYEVESLERKYSAHGQKIEYLVRLKGGRAFWGKSFADIFSSASPGSKVLVLNNKRETTRAPKNSGGYELKDPTASLPSLSASAYLLGDVETGETIASKNRSQVYPIASVSKLMTAVVADESLKSEEKIPITKGILSGGYGNYGNFRAGQILSVKNLFYPLLLSSSNEAAVALSLPFGEKKFVDKMNDKAKTLGMENTSFAEPSGLSSKNISSVGDLFLLTRDVFKNHQNIFSITKEKQVDAWRNINKFAGNENFLGGKIGYTDEALKTSVALFSLPVTEYGTRPIAVIVLHSNDWKKDTEKALDWISNSIFLNQNETYKKITEADFDQEIKSLESVSFTIAGNINMDRNLRDYVAYREGGNFSALTKDTKIIKRNDVVLGRLSGNVHPLFASSLALEGFSALGVDGPSEDSKARLRFEGINIFEKDPVGIKTPNSDLSVALVPIFSDEKTPDKKIETELTRSDIVVSILGTKEKDKLENIETMAKRTIDAGASVAVIYNDPADGENQTLRYKDGIILTGLGKYIGVPGEEGTVFEVRVSGGRKIISVKETPIKISAFYKPTALKKR